MKPAGLPCPPRTSATVCCAVVARAVVRAPAEAVKALRQQPGPPPGEPLPAAFLKHSDDQTVTGLAAVLQAIAKGGLTGTDFTRWGVLASPRFLARVAVAQALKRFALEGAWGVSPHIIPHRSLHSVSGTVSQALKIHGPNFGVGGGPWGAAKAMLAAAALVGDRNLPGVWLTLTGWNWEPGLGDGPPPGAHGQPAVCTAVALALRPAEADARGPVLAVTPDDVGPRRNSSGAIGGPGAPFSLEGLADALEREPAAGVWPLGCGGWVELEPRGPEGENRP